MFCFKCGNELPDNSKFCKSCGAQQNVAPTQGEQQQPSQQPQQEQYTASATSNTQSQQQPYQVPYNNQQDEVPKKKKKGKGCLTTILVIASILIVLVIVAALNGGEIDFTTAGITNVQTATQIDQATSKPIGVTNTFATSAPVIYATASVKNSPMDTVIKSEWWYPDSNILIDQAEIKTTMPNQNFYFSLSRPNNGFPPGNYEVKLFIDGKEDKIVKFTVK